MTKHKDPTSQHKDLTRRHKDATSQHNYLPSAGRNMPPYILLYGITLKFDKDVKREDNTTIDVTLSEIRLIMKT